MTAGGNNFNDFPDNQLTKFRAFIGMYIQLYISMKHRASFTHGMDAPERQRTKTQTNKQTDVPLCKFVCLCLRWSL